MRLPFIKYLQSMVMCRYDNDKIIENLELMPIPLAHEFPEEAIDAVRSNLAQEDPEFLLPPFNKDYPDLELLKSLGITSMVSWLLKTDLGVDVKHIKGAFSLLYDLDMFQKMSALAFANINKQDIELIVQSKYNIHYDESQIEAFLFYFFKVDDWDLLEKKDYLTLIRDDDLYSFYELALEGDKNYLMWKLGIAPQKTFEEMLQDIGSDAYYFFKDKAKYSASEAQSWASVFLRAVERAEKLQQDRDKGADFFKDLNTLIKTVGDISKPSVDLSLPHIEDLNKEEEENNGSSK